MKIEKILKLVLMLIIGSMLIIRPLETFAADESSDDIINDFFGTTEDNTEDDDVEDLGDLDELDPQPEKKPELTPEPTPTPTPTPTPEPEKNETPKKPEEKLPEAGLAEDTMLIVSIIALGAVSIFAYKKVNEYKNI